jgi:hypothetical protein
MPVETSENILMGGVNPNEFDSTVDGTTEAVGGQTETDFGGGTTQGDEITRAYDMREWQKEEFYTLAKNEWRGWQFDEDVALSNNVVFDIQRVDGIVEKFAIFDGKPVQLTKGGKLYSPSKIATNARTAGITNGNGFVRDLPGVKNYGTQEYGSAIKQKL